MPRSSVYQKKQSQDQRKRFWRAFKKNASALFALWSFIALVLITSFSWLTPFDPQYQIGEILLPPSWDKLGKVEYFLGTDDLSRDMLSRLIAGSQITFGYALLIASSAGLIGIFLGTLIGIAQNKISSILNQMLDAALSIPALLLAIILVAFFGTGEHVFWALWLTLLPKFIRASYTAVSGEMSKEYILSARLDGATHFYLLYYAILPNILVSLTNTLTRAISSTILDIAALGFLGLSLQSTSAEWGNMLKESIEFVFIAPWTVILPCSAIFYTVLVINLLGDSMAEAINERTK